MKAISYIQKGNKKLPKTTWILNSGSAKDCPSKKLGLCQCPNKCYALKAERLYPQVLPYREKQSTLYLEITPKEFINSLLESSNRSRKNKMKCFRFNESGDFLNQLQLDWFTEVCKSLSTSGVKAYGYTARTDLNLSELLKYASVNVSNDLNGWQSKGANRFKAVSELSNGLKCVGDCRKCNLCLIVRSQVIQVKMH